MHKWSPLLVSKEQRAVLRTTNLTPRYIASCEYYHLIFTIHNLQGSELQVKIVKFIVLQNFSLEIYRGSHCASTFMHIWDPLLQRKYLKGPTVQVQLHKLEPSTPSSSLQQGQRSKICKGFQRVSILPSTPSSVFC